MTRISKCPSVGHLGPSARTTGETVSSQMYLPFGDIRGTTEVETPYRYTGQREEASIGLYYYNARWYDPVLGRFVQADTIVPSPGDPQSLNRYSYVLNCPLRYVDPTGDIAKDEAEEADRICFWLAFLFGMHVTKDWYQPDFGAWEPGIWELSELHGVWDGAYGLATFMGGVLELRSRIGGHVEVVKDLRDPHEIIDGVVYRIRARASVPFVDGKAMPTITLFMGALEDIPYNVVHELAHVWEYVEYYPKALMAAYCRGEPAPTERGKAPGEDWPETVASAVLGRAALGPLHEAFLALAVRGEWSTMMRKIRADRGTR